LSGGAKIGIGIAAAVGLILVIALGWFCWRRKRKYSPSVFNGNELPATKWVPSELEVYERRHELENRDQKFQVYELGPEFVPPKNDKMTRTSHVP
jgi:hypothetical protein